MSRALPYSLPVIRALLDRARVARFSFGEDTAIVAVQHLLRQTVDLFRTVAELGLNLRNIFVLGKVYSNSPVVVKTLREMGVTVIDTTIPKPGEFYSCFHRDVDRLWQVAAKALAQGRIRRIIVLDDAGGCITSVPSEVLLRYAVCAVEQTSSGIFVVAQSPPPFAVISWARTAVKLEIGGPVFAHTFMEKLNTIFLHGGSLRQKQIGIIGFGSIGKGVATLAARQSGKVCFYDPDPDLKVPLPSPERIARVGSLKELMRRCDYVFGCSGRDPFTGDWPMPHRPGARLFSVSGADREFGPIIDDLKTKSSFKVAPDTWDIVSDHGPYGPIRIAYLGYPYSFVSRRPEAVPGRIVQLETGGLLAALIQARLQLDLFEKGKQDNSGIHRVTPGAQRFVYEKWLSDMSAASIDLTRVFGHDPATLVAARHDRWFIEKTEPEALPDTVEEMMARIVDRSTYSRLDRKTKPDRRTLRTF